MKLTLSIFRSSNNFFYEIFFTYAKMSKDSSAKYCQNDKESLQEQKTTARYQSFSKELKEKKAANVANDEKQKLPENRKKYYKMSKNALL